MRNACKPALPPDDTRLTLLLNGCPRHLASADVDSAHALLMRLVEADAAVRPDRPQFLFTKAGGGSHTVSHPGLPDGEIPCQEADILDLEESRYLRFHPSDRGIIFDVTGSGRRRAAELELSTKASAGGLIDKHVLDWTSRVLPVLNALARAYSRAPSPMGVRTHAVVGELGADADGYSVALTLGELVRAGYLEETLGADQATGPLSSRLTEKGLQVTAGWPSASGEVALDRLLTVIEERIAASTTAEERSNWERLRDGVLGIGRDVFVGVLTATVNSAAKHVAG